MGGGEDGAEGFLERVEIDILDGKSILVLDVEFSPTLGLADMDPVGSFVAGSLETVALDEGLEEDGSKRESFSPVVLNTACGQSEEMGGEVFGPDPGEDEGAGVVDDKGEARLSPDLYPYLRLLGTGDVGPARFIFSRISQNSAILTSS